MGLSEAIGRRMRGLFAILLAGLLLLLPAPVGARVSLSLHLAPTAVLPQPQALPPSTHARLHNANVTLTAPLRRSSRFVFADVPAGSYLCDVWSHEYVFVPMRVDISAVDGDGDGADKKEKGASAIEVWQTFRGNEWGNTGEKLGSATATTITKGKSGEKKSEEAGDDVELEVFVGVLAQRAFYEQRAGFNPMSLLKNPMILIGVVALAMMFGMPKLLENMDPEMREEFEKQQANNPLAAMTGGGSGPSFDMAAWMAGTDKKDADKKDAEKSSGTQSGGVVKKRR